MRRLRLVERGAVYGLADGAVRTAPFKGGRLWEAGKGGTFFPRGFEGLIDDGLRAKGAGGVVDGDKFWGRRECSKVAQAIEDGLPASAAAGDEGERGMMNDER